MKLFLISLFCILQLQFTSHKFYVSVTDIEYITDTQSLQIISRVFADDFEDVLEKRYQQPMVLLPTNETENVNQLISRYINQKLVVSINNQPVVLNFLGKKYEDDRIYLFLEVEKLPPFNEISIENLVLTDLFEEQKNLVHFKNNDKIKSAVLTKGNSTHTFTH